MSLSPRAHTLSDFDFVLPEHLIAQHPAAERSASRLLDARAPELVDRIFKDLPDLLHEGDLLVFNDTKVVKARVFGEKASGGKLELLIERVLQDNEVVAHMKVSKKPLPGAKVHLHGGLGKGGFDATLLGRWPDENGPLFRFALHGANGATPWELMDQFGHLPLPPYIERNQNAEVDPDEAEDTERYQTVFASHPVQWPHPRLRCFDDKVLAALKDKGVETAAVTLHVGAGTFQPVKTENLAEHQMHSEWYNIPLETLAALGLPPASRSHHCRGHHQRTHAGVLARTGQISGDTNIFITPGFEFRVVDCLITNFHLPKSTLMMLVSAFAGYKHIMDVYQHAIAHGYRFFSYGDSMLLERRR
nr:tRNA preQ1(34) S-adenosylmethionine ribosyltransferase-isomerase QueA [Comamonas jiangduensis]